MRRTAVRALSMTSLGLLCILWPALRPAGAVTGSPHTPMTASRPGAASRPAVTASGPAAANTPAATGPTASGPTASAPARSTAELAQQYRQLYGQLSEAFSAKDYAQGEQIAGQMIQLLAPVPQLAAQLAEAYYNKACALARQGKPEEALAGLTKAVETGFDEAEHIKADDDLEGLRKDPRFVALVEEAAQKARTAANTRYERGQPMPGLKMIEALPEGGLRYRLRLSEKASKDKPHRLVIWMHPSGGSMNAQAEALAPILAEKGCALLVLTYKNFLGWSAQDADKLMKKTLPALAEVEGLDIRRPILLGYSAGGQMALELYFHDPTPFGGLVLDAAYPMRRTLTGAQVLAPPKKLTYAQVPVYVVVGLKDGGSLLWRQADKAWRSAGVPLSIYYIPDKPHTWLFDQAQAAELGKWLGKLAAGQLPSQPAVGPASQPDTPPLSPVM